MNDTETIPERGKEECQRAERTCSDACYERARALGCGIFGSMRWSPLTGMKGEIKVFRVVNDEIDTTDEGKAISEKCSNEIATLCEQHRCVLMPVWTALNRQTEVNVAFIAEETLERARMGHQLSSGYIQ